MADAWELPACRRGCGDRGEVQGRCREVVPAGFRDTLEAIMFELQRPILDVVVVALAILFW